MRLAQHEASLGHEVQLTIDELVDSVSDSLDFYAVQDVGDTSGMDCSSSQFQYAVRFANDCEFEGVNERITMPKDRMQLYWPVENQFYAAEAREILEDVRHLVVYDGSDGDRLAIGQETW